MRAPCERLGGEDKGGDGQTTKLTYYIIIYLEIIEKDGKPRRVKVAGEGLRDSEVDFVGFLAETREDHTEEEAPGSRAQEQVLAN